MTEKISSELYDAVQKMNRYMHRNKHRGIKTKEGIHPGQMKLLSIILKNDGIIQRELAEILDMRPSSLTEILSNLEKNSLITRKQDEDDRRVMHVHLTEEGKSSIKNFKQAKEDLHDSVFNCLTLEEKEKMLEIVGKINSSLESLDNVSEENIRGKCECSHNGHEGHHGKCGRHEKCHHGEHKKRMH
ncbi:MarR family winged helix-turn-helix transcriptional regulator [Clostridium nigeriense]|uniref:MarR family winged helix-turn-helix transcriptional regulator n=1 Tax=Clostridium nigeriense TaxID=1805470 RepID=UPI003D3486F9